jgi:5-carboxymethyl-2-hydroxymuconate isomerase
MAHFILEYTDNIEAEADIKTLLAAVNRVLIDQGDVFPIGGIRSRAILLNHYVVADGAADDAFVHCTLKVGAGRQPAVLKRATDAVFDVVKAHFAALFERRSLALSMECVEFSEAGTYKHNNIHARFRKGAG